MNLTVQIPDDLAGRLAAAGGDLSRRALEAFAVEEYKHDRLTKAELQRLLGIESGFELDAFLKAHNAWIGQTKEDSHFDAGRAREAGARIREIRKGTRLEGGGVPLRKLAHLEHKY